MMDAHDQPQPSVTRRQLLRASLVAGGGFLGLSQLLACAPAPAAPSPTSAPAAAAPTTAAAPAAKPTTAPAAAPTVAPAAAAQPTAAPAGAAIKRGGVLRVAIGVAPTVIDPHKAGTGPEWSITLAMFNNLTRTNPKFEVAPELAESWTSSDDLKTWTFKLRKGVKFHHGREMDADDVVASFDRIMNKETASPARSTLKMLDKAEKVDANTVRFNLVAPYADFPSLLANFHARIIAKDQLDTLATAPVGTGPFKFKDFQPGDRVSVTKFDGYWEQGSDGKPLPYLDEVRFVTVAEPSTQATGLTGGSVDVLNEIPADILPQLQNNPQVKVFEVPSPAFQNINMRVDLDPFKDNRVRQAMKYLTDRQGLIKAVHQGHATVGSDTPIPPVSPYYTPMDGLPYDVAKAKSLLADAGLANGLDLELVSPSGNPGLKELGVVFKEMAAAANVRINLRTMPYDVFLAQDFAKAPFVVDQWNGRPHVDELLTLVYEGNGAWNESHLADPRIDAALAKARSEKSLDARKAAYADVQKIFVEEGPMVVPYFINYLSATRANVQGYEAYPIRWTDARAIWLG